MKVFVLTILLAALSAGIGYAQPYGACVNNNSKACVDARNAFARHHGGVYPQQYYNQWYAGNQGRWNQQDNDWRWEGMNGDEYRRGDRGWEWRHERREHEHEYDRERGHEHHHDHDE